MRKSKKRVNPKAQVTTMGLIEPKSRMRSRNISNKYSMSTLSYSRCTKIKALVDIAKGGIELAVGGTRVEVSRDASKLSQIPLLMNNPHHCYSRTSY